MDKQVKILERNNSKHWADIAREMLLNIWHDGDKPVKITVEDYTETRRLAQNSLLFLWHDELSQHIETTTGDYFNSDDIHEHVADNLLPKRVVVIGGEPIIVRTKTSKLHVGKFSDFLSRYDRWAYDKYQCRFSHPDDLYLKAVMQDEK